MIIKVPNQPNPLLWKDIVAQPEGCRNTVACQK